MLTGSSYDYSEDATVAMKVKCVGLDASGCGVKINVTPMSGEGIFSITPCRWYDSIKHVQDARDLNERIKLATEHMKFYHLLTFCTQRRRKLLAEIAELPTETKELFEEDFKENGLSPSKLTDALIGRYLLKLVKIKFDIPNDKLTEFPHYWGR